MPTCISRTCAPKSLPLCFPVERPVLQPAQPCTKSLRRLHVVTVDCICECSLHLPLAWFWLAQSRGIVRERNAGLSVCMWSLVHSRNTLRKFTCFKPSDRMLRTLQNFPLLILSKGNVTFIWVYENRMLIESMVWGIYRVILLVEAPHF